MTTYIDKRQDNIDIISPSNEQGLIKTLNDIDKHNKNGTGHLLIQSYQLTYGKDVTCNIKLPYIIKINKRDYIKE